MAIFVLNGAIGLLLLCNGSWGVEIDMGMRYRSDVRAEAVCFEILIPPPQTP